MPIHGIRKAGYEHVGVENEWLDRLVFRVRCPCQAEDEYSRHYRKRK